MHEPLLEAALDVLDMTPRAMGRTSGGSSLPVVRVDDEDGCVYALRYGPPAAAAVLDRESRNLKAAARAKVPCPRVLRRADSNIVSVLLTTWEAGTVLAEAFGDPSGSAAALARQAGAAQAALHRTGRLALGPELDAGWARPHSAAEEEALSGCDDDGPPTLLHLDFHPLNLLTDGDRISCVLDWVNAGVGDHRRDVARTVSILWLDAAPKDSPLRPAICRILDEWLEGYLEAGGELPAMRPYMVWAGLATMRDLAGKRTRAQLAGMKEEVSLWADGGDLPGHCL